MIRLIQVADDGSEVAAIELDDFIVEVVYSGIAEMLREAASAQVVSLTAGTCERTRAERQRREKILARIRA
jgi:hypothetical protein